MNIVANLFKSSLGKKFIMAISGAALFLFVVGHLLGNLQIFIGPEAINRFRSAQGVASEHHRELISCKQQTSWLDITRTQL